jgi:hypothetical protein
MVYLRTFNDNSISFYENDELEEDDNEEDDSEDIKVNENKQKSLLKKITNYTIKSNQLFKIRSNENLYGSSRNVERPKTVTMRKYEADNVVASDNAIFDESTAILVEDINTNKIVNVYNTIVFTRKKHKDKNE